MRVTISLKILQAGRVLSVGEARAAPGEQTSPSFFAATEGRMRPFTLALSIVGLVERIAITARVHLGHATGLLHDHLGSHSRPEDSSQTDTVDVVENVSLMH